MHDPTVLQWLAFLVVFFAAAGLLSWLITPRERIQHVTFTAHAHAHCAAHGHYYQRRGEAWVCATCDDRRPMGEPRTYGGRS